MNHQVVWRLLTDLISDFQIQSKIETLEKKVDIGFLNGFCKQSDIVLKVNRAMQKNWCKIIFRLDFQSKIYMRKFF